MANKACKFSYTCEFSRQECRGLPPLVGELAEAIESALTWLRKIGGPSNPLWSVNIDYAIDDLETVLERYKEEVGDA